MAEAPHLAARRPYAALSNAGDGAPAHPAQALRDLYTIRRHAGDLTGLRVVMVGDIAHSRVARSDLWGLTLMGAEVVLCAPPTLIPRGLRASERPAHAKTALPPVTIETDIDRALEGADVVMALGRQSERERFLPPRQPGLWKEASCSCLRSGTTRRAESPSCGRP